MILNRAENITIFTTMMTHYMVGNLTAFYEAVVVVVATKVGEKTEGGGGMGHSDPSPCCDPDIVLWRIVSI